MMVCFVLFLKEIELIWVFFYIHSIIIIIADKTLIDQRWWCYYMMTDIDHLVNIIIHDIIITHQCINMKN